MTSLVLVLLAVFLQGQDASWDLRNYHFYTPCALLDGRYADDIAVAQMQTWHNPALDMPFAWLVRTGAPGWLVSLWLAAPAFLALLFALRLLDIAWPTGQSISRTITAGLICVTGAAVLPGIGTTLNDAQVAAGMLAALWWIVASRDSRSPWLVWAPAGLIAGATAGLKLTGAIYCIGLIATTLAAGSFRNVHQRLLPLAIGGATGALLTAGPWAFRLWQEFGNPLFPYFNDWFLSPDALATSHKDTRFVPQGWDAWLVPFHLLFDSQRFSESKTADARILVGMAALTLCAFWPHDRMRRSRTMLLAFASATYVVWVSMYGIYRYLFALELLCAIAIAGMISSRFSSRAAQIALVVVLLVLVGTGNRPRLGRAPFSTPMIDVKMPAIPRDSLVVLDGDQALGYAVTYLPASVPAISFRNNFMRPAQCTRLQARAEQRILGHVGPLYLLEDPGRIPHIGEDDTLPYGLIRKASCIDVPSNLGQLALCPLEQPGTVNVECPLTGSDR